MDAASLVSAWDALVQQLRCVFNRPDSPHVQAALVVASNIPQVRVLAHSSPITPDRFLCSLWSGVMAKPYPIHSLNQANSLFLDSRIIGHRVRTGKTTGPLSKLRGTVRPNESQIGLCLVAR